VRVGRAGNRDKNGKTVMRTDAHKKRDRERVAGDISGLDRLHVLRAIGRFGWMIIDQAAHVRLLKRRGSEGACTGEREGVSEKVMLLSSFPHVDIIPHRLRSSLKSWPLPHFSPLTPALSGRFRHICPLR